MTTIIGFIIVGVCLLGCAFILSAAISGAVSELKETAPQPLQQPTLKYLTEFDAADYIGVSLQELDYMRAEGMLDGSFMAVTSLEQTGEEEYTDIVDGVEVLKTRPVMSNVTRFLFNCQLLDQCILDLIKSGHHVNPNRRGGAKYKKPAPVTDMFTGAPVEKAPAAPEQKPAEPEAPAVDKKAKTETAAPAAAPAAVPADNAQSAGVFGSVPTTSGDDDAAKSKVAYSDHNDGRSSDPSPVYNPEARTADFPIVKPAAKVVSRPKIAIMTDDGDDTVDFMSAGRPNNPKK